MANKISTQSYFIKRLKDSGYVVWKIFENYNESDPRAWTVLIDPGISSVFCTCYVNHPHYIGQTIFEMYDGGRFIPTKLYIDTLSIEVIIQYLVRYGINNKSESYNERTKKST